MSVVQSNKIKVFPSAWRTSYPESKYTTEQNFVNILNSITDKDSYILDFEGGVIRFVIHGYFFTVENFTVDNKSKYASIKVIADKLVRVDNGSLQNLDASGNFYGLQFTESEVTEPNTYSLLISKAGSNQIAQESLVKFKSTAIMLNDSTLLNDELNNKQYKLTNGQGIANITSNKSSNNVVEINDKEFNKLKSLEDLRASAQDPRIITFDSAGKAVPSTISSGSKSGLTYQSAYVKNGVFQTDGQTVYISSESPQSSAGKVGDIWFKYGG